MAVIPDRQAIVDNPAFEVYDIRNEYELYKRKTIV